MRDAFNLCEEIAAGVRDADGAWQFIRRFTATCATPVMPGDGCDDAELHAAEDRLGVALPVALWQMYTLIGRRDDLTRGQDVLLTPAELHLDDSGEVLVFRRENQGVTRWGVPLTAVGEPDPPVVFLVVGAPQAERSWRLFLDRVSLACVEMVLTEWVLGCAGFAGNRDLNDDAIAVLERRFRRLPMPDYPLWWRPDGPPMRWFAGQGSILWEHPGTWLWVGAVSANALAAVREELPGDWLMTND